MAVKTGKNGLIILASGDTYSAAQVGSKQIYSVLIVDTVGGSALTTLSDSTGNVLLVHSSPTASTIWYDLCGCVSTGNGLAYSGAGTTAYVYVR